MDLEGRELLEGEAHLWNLIYSYNKSMSLKCAIDLGIPDIIHNHGHPITLSELIDKLLIPKSKSNTVYSLMRLLVNSGIFAKQKINEEEEEEGYVLTAPSRLLLKDDAMSLSKYALLSIDPVLVTPGFSLGAWLKSDDLTAFETTYGINFWDYLGKNPKFGNFFNEGLANDSRFLMNALLKGDGKKTFEGLKSLVDVGGGTGTVVRAIVEAFPNLKCTIFDLPQVVSNLKGSGNIEYVGGDMFEAIPPADAVLLKSVLHDWCNEDCVKILKRCKEAITSEGKEGKVIIIDMVVKDNKGEDLLVETQLLFDMLMAILCNGKEKSEKEWERLFLEAGFSRYKVIAMLGIRSLIELYP